MNNSELQWNGARWWKFDFHTHTPASNDYGKGPNQSALKKISPREWLLKFMRAGVDCIAITDHNTGAWIDRVKTAYSELESEEIEDFRQLHIFPGMEISVVSGVHLLAIMGCDKTTSDLDALRGAVGYRGKPGQSDDVTTKSFVEVVKAIVSAGGIAIPAHVDEEKNGLFRLSGTTLQQVLSCDDIFAMELLNPNFQKPQAYINKKVNWTEILGSDAHHPIGKTGQQYPGSHFTWVKMGSPGIEGLRLALLDGGLSVLRSDQVDRDPNAHVDSIIEKIEVSNTRHLGRACRPFTFTFNPWLNAIIGGRGTGKSTAVEFLRIALRREYELPDDLQPEFEKYGQVYLDREDSGLLTHDAVIRVIYQKNGSRFRIQWNPAGSLEPIQEEIDGKWSPTKGDIRQRFSARIYSQKQIFQLANTPLALLRVVDDAPEVNHQAWGGKWKAEESRFLSLRAKVREIEAGLDEESHLLGELDDVKRKLALFEQTGHTEILQSFQKRIRQQRDIEEWEKSWTHMGEQLRKVAPEIVPDILDEMAFDSNSASDNELQEYATRVLARLDEIRKGVEALASQVDTVVVEWKENRDKSRWKQGVDDAAQAYQTLRETLDQEGAGHPAAYGELVQYRQIIEEKLKKLDERKKQIVELNNQSMEQLQRLVEIRRELTGIRRKFLRNTLGENPYIQIRVLPYGASETVEDEFRQLLQRPDGGFDRDIGTPDNGEGLLGKLYGDSNDAEIIEQHLANIKNKIRTIDSETVADKRFRTHIRKLPPEVIDRLDLWFPEDSLDVQYSPTGDGKHFRSIREGSPGQKTAALLAFLLSYGEEPLILDQPEDDLDNHLIYDLIVTQLRQVKRDRQVIVVTHNANIVVNGDAELVVALEAHWGETKKECEGSLQERRVRETICAIMEGGRKAFEDRYRRITLEEHRV